MLSATKTTRLLGPGDYRVVPWKNGGGSTTELAVHPEGATMASGFDWRLSVAKLAGPGPFSPFPGLERIIVQLSGPPMRLEHGPHGSQVLTRLRPYRFPGAWTTIGELPVGAEATDFNVMTRSGKVAAHVESLALAEGRTLRRQVDGTLAVYVVDGAVTVDGGPLGKDGLALVDGAGEAEVRGRTASAQVLLAHLGRRG